MTSPIVKCSNLTKEFQFIEPGSTSSSTGMWVHYIGGLMRRVHTDDPYAPKRKRLIAVDDVNLEIHRGEVFGLLGPNGAGKTTLIKMLATLLRPSQGTAWVNGRNVISQGKQVRRSIAVVSSSGWLGFDLQLPIEWNLSYWATIYGVDPSLIRQRVQNVLKIVGLSDKAAESSSVLSSGMRQRLAIAKGLLVDAPVILMDEPTVALDPKAANDIRDFIKQVVNHDRNTTVIVSTQNMQEAEELCYRVAILGKGRIIACESPDILKRDVGNTVVYLEATHLSIDLLRKFQDKFHIQHRKYRINPGPGRDWCRFHLANGERRYHDMKQFLEACGLREYQLLDVPPTLEDVYLSVTGKELINNGQSA